MIRSLCICCVYKRTEGSQCNKTAFVVQLDHMLPTFADCHCDLLL